MNKKRIYSPTQAAMGAFLGGPLASVVFLRQNFRTIGDANGETKTAIFGAAFMLLFLGILPFIPETFPNMAIPLATVIATRTIVEKLQYSKQAIASSDSMTFQSNWRVLLVALACFVVFFAVAMALLLGLDHFGIVAIA